MHPIKNLRFYKILQAIYEECPTALPVSPTEFCLNYSTQDTYDLVARYFGLDVQYGMAITHHLHKLPALDFSELRKLIPLIDHRFLFIQPILGFFRASLQCSDGDIDNTMMLTTAFSAIPEEVKLRLLMLQKSEIDSGYKNVSAFIRHYCVCLVLGIDLGVFEYWDFTVKPDEAIAKTGITKKEVVRRMLKAIPDEEHPGGCFKEFFTLSHLNNLGRIEGTYNRFAHRCSMGQQNYSDKKNPQLTKQSISWGIEHSIAHGKPLPGEVADMFDSNWGDRWGALLWFWLRDYRGWFDRGTTVEINGVSVYVHHHSVVEDHCRELTDFELWHKGKKFEIPETSRVKPSDFYHARIQMLAKRKLKKLKRSYGGLKFPPLSDRFKLLDPQKWRHISNPIDLSQEGAKMHHCVGGEYYVRRALDGDIFYHYNDGSPAGLTVQLVPNEQWGYVGVSWEKPDELMTMPKAFCTGQIKGAFNAEPLFGVMQELLDDLRGINDTSAKYYEQHKDRILGNFQYSHPLFEPRNPNPTVGRGFSQGTRALNEFGRDFDGDMVGAQHMVRGMQRFHDNERPRGYFHGYRYPDLGRGRDYISKWTSGSYKLDKPPLFSLVKPEDFLSENMFTHESRELFPLTDGRAALEGYFTAIYCLVEAQTLAPTSTNPFIHDTVLQRFIRQKYVSRILFGGSTDRQLAEAIVKLGNHTQRITQYRPEFTDLRPGTAVDMTPRINYQIYGGNERYNCMVYGRPFFKSSWVPKPTQRYCFQVDWCSPIVKEVFGINGVGDYILNVANKRNFDLSSQRNEIRIPS